MSMLDKIMSVVLALVISLLDGLILGGPKLGLIGFLLSFFLAALGWFAGMALVHVVGATVDRRARAYRRVLWWLTVALCVVIAAGVVSYYVFVIAGKTSYPNAGDKLLHFFVIFATATAVRAMPYAAKAAAKAEENARRQSRCARGAAAPAGPTDDEGQDDGTDNAKVR